MRASPRGFTLLEVLIAITLVALIAGSLYGSLYVGFRAQRSATTAIAPARIASLTMELVRQDIDGAVPPTGILAGQFLGSDGLGSNGYDILSFFSSANVPAPGEAGSDVRRVELDVTIPTDELQNGMSARPALIRRVTANLMPSGAPYVREEVLCRNVTNFELRYFDGTQWLESWDSTGQGDLLPLGVEVILEFATEDTLAAAQPRIYSLRRVMEVPCGRTATTIGGTTEGTSTGGGAAP